MILDERAKRIKEIMDKVGKIPVKLPLSEAEHYVLAQWITQIAVTSYETGLEDR